MYYRILNNEIVATYPDNIQSVFLSEIDEHISISDFNAYSIYQSINQNIEYNPESQKISGYDLQVIDGLPTNVPQLVDLSEQEITDRLITKRNGMIITPRQARLALLYSEMLSTIESTIASLPEPDKSTALIEWEYATAIKRTNAWIINLTQALGISDTQLDDLFIYAATIPT